MIDLYWDNAATTAPFPTISSQISTCVRERYANPSSSHDGGRRSSNEIHKARDRLAEFLGSRSGDVVFTGSGSEANNLAIRGVLEPRLNEGIPTHAIVSAVEHKAVLNTVESLEQRGLKLERVPVNEEGAVDPSELEKRVNDHTALVSIMWANNETGIINPIRDIGRALEDRDVLFHTDAVQAVGKIPLEFDDVPLDMLSLSGHKFHALKGIGALVRTDGVELAPIIYGGGQERGLRSGTENLPGIWSLGMAANQLEGELSTMSSDLETMRDAFEEELARTCSGVEVVGRHTDRLPNISTVVVEDVSGTRLVHEASERGLALSAGSACDAGGSEPKPSHVMRALKLESDRATSVIRVSFGHLNEAGELEPGIDRLSEAISTCRGS